MIYEVYYHDILKIRLPGGAIDGRDSHLARSRRETDGSQSCTARISVLPSIKSGGAQQS